MRAYVLVNPKNSRLVDEKITTYPTCLPNYDVIYGYTLDDNLEVPDWYREHRGCKDNEKRKRGYCAYLGHMHSIVEHYKKYPTEDLLIMEDDVEFIPEFNTYYRSFMKMVPDDWDAVYFGGWYKQGIPTEIVPNVLKVNATCRLYGVECTLLRAKLVKRIVDFFNGDDHSPGLQLDGTLADWAQQDKIKTYTPIVHFAHQKVCFSAVANKIIDRNYIKNTVTNYTAMNGMTKASTSDDLLRYRTDPVKIYAYVLTNKVNNRLVDNKIPNYPCCLPSYKVIYGPTPKDGLVAPDRFIGAPTTLDTNTRNALFCCFTGFINVLKEHIATHPNDLLLFMEDDVEFDPNFNEYYFNFMKMVPDDWDIINFGGCDVSEAIEVKHGVVSNNIMVATECCLMKPSIINELIDYYDTCDSNMLAYDLQMNILVSSGDYKRYIPLYSFTRQKPGYTLNNNEVTNGTSLTRRLFKYTNLDGNILSNSKDDLNNYKYNILDNDTKAYVYSNETDIPNTLKYPDIFSPPKPFSSNLLLLLKEHLFRYPNSNALIFDSKVVFNNLFKHMYSSFITRVPDDCGILFFGGKYDSLSIKINDLVLKPNSIENNDCFIILAKYIPKLISFLESNDSNFLNNDILLSDLDIPAYTPIIRFASSINSNYSLVNSPICINVSNPVPYDCKYITKDGTATDATYADAITYLKEYMPKASIYVPIFGGIGNNLFMICFSRWCRSFGINAISCNKTSWGQQTIDFINDVVHEPLHNFGIKVGNLWTTDRYKALYDSLIVGQHWYLDFYPELRDFIDLSIDIKPIIGINVRRGDFLTHPYKSCNLAFCDLCERHYYYNAAKIAKKLGLPVRIISDEPDKIPKEIIDLFDNPELMHGTFKEDFYNLAECKYKFISNSTFSYWAAYAAPDATVFYPKGCRDDIKLDEWTPLELSDMSDEELEKITPKEEKSE